MRHFERLEQVAMRLHEGVESRQIFVPSCQRGNNPARSGFEVLENFWFGKWKFDLIGIEDLENDHFMAVEAKLLESERDVFGGLEEVGKEKNDAEAMDQPNGLLQELGE